MKHLEQLINTFGPARKVRADCLQLEVEAAIPDLPTICDQLHDLFVFHNEIFHAGNIATSRLVLAHKKLEDLEAKNKALIEEIERLKQAVEWSK